MHSIGLTLSGGGMKGMAHLGVLKYLEEIDLKVDLIAGTSAGALAGSLYATGYSPEEILNIGEEIYKEVSRKPLKYSQFIHKQGLLKTELIAELFAKHLGDDKFEKLKTDLMVFSTNMNSGEQVIFTSGIRSIEVSKAVWASAAYPFVFSPVKIGDSLCSDGGILNHFPAELCKSECRYVIGSYVSPLSAMSDDDLDNATSIALRAMSLQGLVHEQENFAHCDVLLNPEGLTEYTTFEISFSKAKVIFELGYNEAKKHHNQLLKLKMLAEFDEMCDEDMGV